MGLRIKNFNIMEVPRKIWWGRVSRNQYIGENCLKRGALTVADLTGTWQKRRTGYFWEGGRVDTPMHTIFLNSSVHLVKTSLIRLVFIPPTEHILAWYKISSNLLLLRNFLQLLKKCMKSWKSPRFKMTSLNSSGLIQIAL